MAYLRPSPRRASLLPAPHNGGVSIVLRARSFQEEGTWLTEIHICCPTYMKYHIVPLPLELVALPIRNGVSWCVVAHDDDDGTLRERERERSVCQKTKVLRNVKARCAQAAWGLPLRGLSCPDKPSGPGRQPAAERVIFWRENAR